MNDKNWEWGGGGEGICLINTLRLCVKVTPGLTSPSSKHRGIHAPPTSPDAGAGPEVH